MNKTLPEKIDNMSNATFTGIMFLLVAFLGLMFIGLLFISISFILGIVGIILITIGQTFDTPERRKHKG